MILYRFLADLVVVAHAVYAGAVVFGLLAILLGIARGWRWVRNFWVRITHLMMILIVAIQALAGIPCPLTELEKYLRARGGDATYPGSFIGHWVNALLFYDFAPWVFTLTYCLFGALVLATLILAPPQFPWGSGQPRDQ
jgi:hypothetical protein